MKGLIRNNFYSMGGGMKIAFLMSAVLMFIPLFTKDYKILTIVIAIQIFCFISNTGAALRADEVSKWNKFELTLPVKASTVVAAKYLSFGDSVRVCHERGHRRDCRGPVAGDERGPLTGMGIQLRTDSVCHHVGGHVPGHVKDRDGEE